MEIDPHRVTENQAVNRVVHQSGVVAFRWNGGQPEICLITSRRSKRWGFPKGRIGRQVTMKRAALQEALDEAGLEGAIIGEPLSQYTFKKGGKKHDVLMYLMQVQRCHNDWKEAQERARQWVSLETAGDLIDRKGWTRILLAATARIATLDPVSHPGLFPAVHINAKLSGSPPVPRR